ncbi:hypothetical protein ACQP00_27695 [Dactylosporangium sp. CS-047395]|uniref:hypothetical protein n=1 Tax=Dactylosporangium sp. CS-047395 TaxID=3239936 RepID=UPI003D948FB2
MSYDLAVWEGDRPADDAAGAAEFQRLYGRHAGDEPTARIAAYVAALLERYPDIDTDDGADSPWSTGPLIGEARGPLVYFPMVWSACEEVSAWAADLAAEHGLQCFDPQENRMRTPANRPATVPRVAKVTPEDIALFDASFTEHGWTGTRRRKDGRQTLRDYQRDATPDSRIVARLTFNPTTRGVEVSATIGVEHDAVNDLYLRFLGSTPGGIWTYGRSVADLVPRDGGHDPWTRWK